MNGNEYLVRYLVEYEADINEHGAYINKQNKDDAIPLFFACVKGHENIVKYLVEQGADINKQDNKTWKYNKIYNKTGKF